MEGVAEGDREGRKVSKELMVRVLSLWESGAQSPRRHPEKLQSMPQDHPPKGQGSWGVHPPSSVPL